jgi:hypothetical protein
VDLHRPVGLEGGAADGLHPVLLAPQPDAQVVPVPVVAHGLDVAHPAADGDVVVVAQPPLHHRGEQGVAELEVVHGHGEVAFDRADGP